MNSRKNPTNSQQQDRYSAKANQNNSSKSQGSSKYIEDYPEQEQYSQQQQESFRRHDNQEELDNQGFDEEIISSKLPQLSEIINMKFRAEDKEFHNQIIDIVRYAQNLENIVKYKNREIERLQYLIKYLTIAQQKRDEMLSHIQEENRKFKEHNAYLESINKRPFQRTPLSGSQLPNTFNQSSQGQGQMNLGNSSHQGFQAKVKSN